MTRLINAPLPKRTPEREAELKRKLHRLRQEQMHSFNTMRIAELSDTEFQLERMQLTRMLANL